MYLRTRKELLEMINNNYFDNIFPFMLLFGASTFIAFSIFLLFRCTSTIMLITGSISFALLIVLILVWQIFKNGMIKKLHKEDIMNIGKNYIKNFLKI